MSNLSWSYSMFSKASECLACFEKSYILKLPQAGPESADLAFGTAMHSAINAQLTGEDGAAVFETYWGSYEGKELATTRFNYEQLAAMGMKFLKNFYKYEARLQLEKSEIRLYGEYNGVKLEGTFDFYGSLDGRRSLLDWKTAAYNYPASKRDTALQPYLYTYLARQNGYTPPEQLGYLVFNKGAGTIQAPLVWDFDESVMHAMLGDMTAYCKMFETLTVYPRNPNAARHNYACFEAKENI